MKRIVCELCENTEFNKEEGMFVCQGCGTKYTPEEAKGMMKEVEGNVTSTSIESIPSVDSNQQKLDNLLVLATNAFESGNNAESENYCNKIIEIDVNCYKAWLLKGQAICWQSTYSNQRVMESANVMRKAVDFAPEEEKEIVAKQAILCISAVCNALYSLVKENFGQNPIKDNRDKFFEFGNLSLEAIDLFENVSEDVKQFIFEQSKEEKREIAKFMNRAGLKALKVIREKWNAIQYPNENSFQTYLSWLGEVETIFAGSIFVVEDVDEDDAIIIGRYKNLIIAIEEPMDACSWDQQWQSWRSSYAWVKDRSLADSAKAERRNRINECNEAIKKIENKVREKEAAKKKAAEDAKKARIEAYWETHKEEKDRLESEKKNLEDKYKDINAQITELNKQIKEIKEEEKVKVPSEIEEDNLHEKIRELSNRRANLGIFSGKEKKQISEEILAIEGRITLLKTKVEEENKTKSDEIKVKVEPLNAKKTELTIELTSVNKKISAINAELSKDPEE